MPKHNSSAIAAAITAAVRPGITRRQVIAWVKAEYGVETFAELTAEDIADVRKRLAAGEARPLSAERGKMRERLSVIEGGHAMAAPGEPWVHFSCRVPAGVAAIVAQALSEFRL